MQRPTESPHAPTHDRVRALEARPDRARVEHDLAAIRRMVERAERKVLFGAQAA